MEKISKPLAFEFAVWLGENYVRLHKFWVPRFSSQLDGKNYKTTEQLFEEFAKFDN